MTGTKTCLCVKPARLKEYRRGVAIAKRLGISFSQYALDAVAKMNKNEQRKVKV